MRPEPACTVRRNRRGLSLGIAVAAIAIAALGCADRSAPVIGVAMGLDAATPQPLLQARQQRFNDSVGVQHAVKLLFMSQNAMNSRNPPLAWANELVGVPGLAGVVGHESSRYTLQAAPLYREREVVQIVPTGTSGRLATVSPWTLPLVASDASEGELLARHLLAVGIQRVTLFVQDDEYGRGIVDALTAALSGTNIRMLENVMQTSESDYPLLVRSVLSHDPQPEALVLITQGGVAEIIARLAWAQQPSLHIVGTDATASGATALRKLAPAPDRLAIATYWVPDTTSAITRAFLKDYQNSGLPNDPQWGHAALYDAVGLLTAAAAEVGSRPSDVRAWLLSLGRNRPPYQGVLGAIDFTGQRPIRARMVRPTATGWEPVP